LVAPVSLAGVFDLYDIFLSIYIAPGLVASGLFRATTPGLFDSMASVFSSFPNLRAWSGLSVAFARLLIGFFREGGALGVALFLGGATVVMIVTIRGFGPCTRQMALEEIAK
jgi:hypothetical protein